MTEDPTTGPTGDGSVAPAPSASEWAAGVESVDDRDGTSFAPSEDTVRLSLGGQPPLPDAQDAPTVPARPVAAPEAVAQPQVPLGPPRLTFPAQDVQPPAAASQQDAPAQPTYQPHTPYQPQPYLQTLQSQSGQQAEPAQQPQPPQQPQLQQPQAYQAQPYVQPQPQPYPAPPGYQPLPLPQPVFIQPPIYVQPTVYGQPGVPPIAYGQPVLPQPGVLVPPSAAPSPVAPPQANLAGPPSMLAAAADRERAVDVLKAAYGEGRVTKDEFDERVHQVTQARTYADLAVVVADLPAGPLGGVSHYPGNLPAPAPYYPPARQSTNGLAVGSLVCALLGISLPAVIMGHVARKQIRDRSEGGDALAIAGLVIGWLGMAFYALIFIAAIINASNGGG